MVKIYDPNLGDVKEVLEAINTRFIESNKPLYEYINETARTINRINHGSIVCVDINGKPELIECITSKENIEDIAKAYFQEIPKEVIEKIDKYYLNYAQYSDNLYLYDDSEGNYIIAFIDTDYRLTNYCYIWHLMNFAAHTMYCDNIEGAELLNEYAKLYAIAHDGCIEDFLRF